jgi:hypothetical protein
MVDCSTCGAVFLAIKRVVEIIRVLKDKLWMLGIEILEGEKIFGNNMTAVLISSLSVSTLKRKHHLVNYIYVREA